MGLGPVELEGPEAWGAVWEGKMRTNYNTAHARGGKRARGPGTREPHGDKAQ